MVIQSSRKRGSREERQKNLSNPLDTSARLMVNIRFLKNQRNRLWRFEVLANHKSALKKIRRDELRRARNKSVRTRYRNLIKAVRTAMETGDAAGAGEALKKAVPYLQKAASKGVVHANKASRNISRLTSQVESLGAK